MRGAVLIAALALAGLVAVAAVLLCGIVVINVLERVTGTLTELTAMLEDERRAHRNEVAELLNRLQHPRIYQPTPEQEQTIRQAVGPDEREGADLFELAGRDYGDEGPVPEPGQVHLEAVDPPLPVGEPEPAA